MSNVFKVILILTFAFALTACQGAFSLCKQALDKIFNRIIGLHKILVAPLALVFIFALTACQGAVSLCKQALDKIFNRVIGLHKILVAPLALVFIFALTACQSEGSHTLEKGDYFSYNEQMTADGNVTNRIVNVVYDTSVNNYYKQRCIRVIQKITDPLAKLVNVTANVNLIHQNATGDVYNCGTYDINTFNYNFYDDAPSSGLRLSFPAHAELGQLVNKYSLDNNTCYRGVTSLGDYELNGTTYSTYNVTLKCGANGKFVNVESQYAPSLSAVVSETQEIRTTQNVVYFARNLIDYQLVSTNNGK